jgi:hypothetical protein
MDAWSVITDVVTKLSGPVALIASLLAIVVSFFAILKTRAELPKIPREIKKIDVETSKIGLEATKIPREIEKLQTEVENLKASAISNTIIAHRAKINCAEIVECCDKIAEHAKAINSGLFQAYEVFFELTPSSKKLQNAYSGIVKFVEESAHRGDFEQSVAKLEELLRPLNVLNVAIAQELWLAADEFRGLVSRSRQLDFPKILRDAHYHLNDDKLKDFQDWIYRVRKSYEALSRILGRVAAQVERSA